MAKDPDMPPAPKCKLFDMNPRLSIAWCLCGETILIPDAIAQDMGFHRKQDFLLDLYNTHKRLKQSIDRGERNE